MDEFRFSLRQKKEHVSFFKFKWLTHMRKMRSRAGPSTHKLWDDDCFYVSLDLPQKSGFIIKLILNLIITLKAEKKMFS